MSANRPRAGLWCSPRALEELPGRAVKLKEGSAKTPPGEQVPTAVTRACERSGQTITDLLMKTSGHTAPVADLGDSLGGLASVQVERGLI